LDFGTVPCLRKASENSGGHETIHTMTLSNIHKSYFAGLSKNLHFFGAITIPFFIDWLKVDYTKAFVLQAWFVFWLFVLEIPTGVIADKFGRTISVGLGCLLFGLITNQARAAPLISR
jgi:hypothetical protein